MMCVFAFVFLLLYTCLCCIIFTCLWGYFLLRGAELFQATIVKAVKARIEEEKKSMDQLKRQYACFPFFHPSAGHLLYRLIFCKADHSSLL